MKNKPINFESKILLESINSNIFSTLYHLCVAHPTDHLLDVYQHIGMIFFEKAILFHDMIVQPNKNTKGSIIKRYAKFWCLYNCATIRIDAICMYLNKVITKLGPSDGEDPDNIEHLTMHSTIPKHVPIVINGSITEIQVQTVRLLSLQIWRRAVLNRLCESVEGTSMIEEMNKLLHDCRINLTIPDSQTILDFSETINSFVPGDVINARPHVSNSIDFLDYAFKVESLIVQTCSDFYRESSRKFQSESIFITDYVRYVDQRLRFESELVTKLLPARSAKTVIATVEKELLSAHASRLYSEFGGLLEGNKIADLELVFCLLKRVPGGVEPLSASISSFIIDKTTSIIKLASDNTMSQTPKGAILARELTPILKKMRELVSHSFDNSSDLNLVVNSAFSQALSQDKSIGYTLADFIHVLLVEDFKVVVEQMIEEILVIIELIPDRKSFSEAYILKLAERLIFRLSKKVPLESGILGRLHDLCGADFVIRMRKMLGDIHQSHMLRDLFSVKQMDAVKVELCITVPTHVVWPIQAEKVSKAYEPDGILSSLAQAYDDFYRKAWPNRRLRWLNYLSRVCLVCTISSLSSGSRQVEIIATIPQSKILTAFLDTDIIVAKDLAIIAGFDLESEWHQFESCIAPIVSACILTVDRDDLRPQITTESNIQYNQSWACVRSRIYLAPPSLSDVISVSTSKILSDREEDLVVPGSRHQRSKSLEASQLSERQRQYLQALIVRIMKRHRDVNAMHLFVLITEEVERTSVFNEDSNENNWRPNAPQVEALIEVLIEKEYIERDERIGLLKYMP